MQGRSALPGRQTWLADLVFLREPPPRNAWLISRRRRPQHPACDSGTIAERTQLCPHESVLAITRSEPTRRASLTKRSATSSGCSTTLVAWLMTPGKQHLGIRATHRYPTCAIRAGGARQPFRAMPPIFTRNIDGNTLQRDIDGVSIQAPNQGLSWSGSGKQATMSAG